MERTITFERGSTDNTEENAYFQEALYHIENMSHNLDVWADNIGTEKGGLALQLFKQYFNDLTALYQQDDTIFAEQCYNNLYEACAPILSYIDSVEFSYRSADFALGREVEKIVRFLDALFDQWAVCRDYSEERPGLSNLFD